MFFLIALLIWVVVHVYVFWRLRPLAPRLPRWVLWLMGALLGSAYLLSRFASLAGLDRFAEVLEVIGATWIGVLFLLFLCLLVADLLTGFGRLLPQKAPWVRAAAVLLGLGLAAVAFVQAAREPVVTPYEVRLAGLPQELDGTVVVVASDLHLGSLIREDWLAARVQQIAAERPDLIILAGDIVEGHGPRQHDFAPVLRQLAAPLGVWAVTGNHDFYGQAAHGRLIEEAGIPVLHDRWTEMRPGLVLAGVDDLTVRRYLTDVTAFPARALAGRPHSATLYLSHTPWFAQQAATAGASLMISGHTHNGQIWPFTYVVALIHPLVAGRYQVGEMPVIVSRGAGTWGPRMRLWRRGEILRITLRAR